MKKSLSLVSMRRAAIAVPVTMLLACGGGGGGDNSVPTTPIALTLAAAPAIAPANGTTGADYAPAVQFTASKALAAAGIKLVCDSAEVAGKTTVAGAVAKGVLVSLGSLAAGSPSGGQADPPIEHIDLG